MKPVAKLTKKYQVMVSDADFTNKLKMSAAFNYFQEIAGLHSDSLGIGFNTIQKNPGVAWVLTRMRVDIIKYPIWDQEVYVETWPQIPRKYEFERDFFIKDLDGNIMVRAISTWAIINIKTRSLEKTEAIAIEYPEIVTERAIDCKLTKPRASGGLEIAYKRVVGCSDIDMNGHLNNSKYIDFIMDCFTVEDVKSHFVKSIQVNYISEALPGDTIVLYKDNSMVNEGKLYIEGINEKDGSVIFKSIILFEELK